MLIGIHLQKIISLLEIQDCKEVIYSLNRIRTSKKIVFVDECLVNHFATSENRVTTIPSNKKQGLDLFYRKYLHQFSKELQEKSLSRAKKLFNYTLSDSAKKRDIISIKKTAKKEIVKPFNLIIGTISDNAGNLTELFKSFLNLYQKYGKHLSDYRFLILENTSNEYEIRPIINYFVSKKNLNIELISWVIDDDNLFKFDSQNETVIPNYFKIISEQSNNGIDAMFGLNSDAPPLPFLSTLRSQLIDFYYNLTYFANCNPREKFELNKLQEINIEHEEFYYDLSNRHFQHLEYPYYQNSQEQTNIEAFNFFLKETALLSNGVNVFRKLTFAPETVGNITNKASIYRGGNTIIFNPELLKTPNYTPEKEYNRRSDFNWSIINKDIFKRKLYEIVLPLKHDRKLQKTSLITNENKLQADIKGLIFYRLFENIVSKENWESKTNHKNELEILKNVKLWWFKNEYRKDINYNIQQNIFIMEVLRIELGKRKFQALLQDLEDNMKMDNDFINKVILEIKRIKELKTAT